MPAWHVSFKLMSEKHSLFWIIHAISQVELSPAHDIHNRQGQLFSGFLQKSKFIIGRFFTSKPYSQQAA